MADERTYIDDIFVRTGSLAMDWITRLTKTMPGVLPLDRPRLYRWSDPEQRTRAHSDGSITLSRQTAATMAEVGHDRHDARNHDPERPEPPRTMADLRRVRAAASDFCAAYVESVLPRAELTGSDQALDIGVRGNMVDVSSILNGMHGYAHHFEHLGGIDSVQGPDRAPLHQGAAAVLTAWASRRTGLRPGEVDALLRQTPPAQRFDVLASRVAELDNLQNRLPDGSRRRLPADHLDRLKSDLSKDLRETFARVSFADQTGSRARGKEIAEGGLRAASVHLRQYRDSIHTSQRGYREVAGLVSAVQSELAIGRGLTAADRNSGVYAQQLKANTDYWSGELHESTESTGELGAAGTDRSLTFDRDRVIEVLAGDHTEYWPSTELRAAVRAVGTQAARLCNPEGPGATPLNAADQALESGLTEEFVSRHESQLFGKLRYIPYQLTHYDNTQTTTAQVVATLSAEAGRRLGLEPHEVTARLLTTPPAERVDRAVAFALEGEPAGPQLDQAKQALSGEVRSVLTDAAAADHAGKTRLHLWSQASAGDALSQKVTKAIGSAQRSLGATRPASNDNWQQVVTAATSGQAPPGRPQQDAQNPTNRRQHPGQDRSGQGQSGRG
ncbi:hypothetical protein [Kribbella solani]|uniref:hypothetical protein n=1 Tax=Kribbella solani TaxID=236067 RepID=UPI0029A3AC26|nr:hypothetical protein [Kribbella solani]MDX2968360.1 hypothetical protein [Kribbella solani]